MSGSRVASGPEFDSDSGRYALLDQLAAEFADRHRRGERPAVRAYLDRYPELADEIRELFPALVAIERVEEDRSAGGDPSVAAPALTRVGDFRIIRQVGRGGMGVVFEAEQISLGRRVALKVLPDVLLRDDRTVERFRREARAAARLHHTNIVPVFEVGQDGDVAYYAMQFIQGQGLDQVIAELRRLRHASDGSRPAAPRPGGHRTARSAGSPRPDGLASWDRTLAATESLRSRQLGEIAGAVLSGTFVPEAAGPPGPAPPSPDPVDSGSSPGSTILPGGMPLSSVDSSGRRGALYRSVARIGQQVAEGLAYAHDRGVTHRDIKPSNLLLDTAGVVWITDFGLAKADEDGLTHTGDLVGTMRYMAPERFRGQADGRSDVYGLGLTLYELLVLRPAFPSSDRVRLMERIQNEDPVRPRAIDPSIPRNLETIVLKAMARDRADRYATAAELAEDLHRFLEDRTIRARRAGAWERAVRWCRRNPVVTGLLATVFVLLVAVSAGYLRTRRALEREAQQRATALSAEARASEEARRARAAEREMKRQWYAASISLMQQAWDRREGGHLRELLASTAAYPERDFEWAYWQRLSHLELRSFIGHRAVVRSVAWSPDGMALATGSTDGTAKVWDVAGGREPLTLTGHRAGVLAVSWSPDGARLATGGVDGTARVWDPAAARELRTLRGAKGPVTSVSWSPDGARLATGSMDGTVRVWDAVAAHEPWTLEGHRTGDRAVSWSPDGRRLATCGGDGMARVWDATGGRELLTLSGHRGDVLSVSWSGDGARLATGGADGTVKVWDAAEGRELFALEGLTSQVSSVAWSPEGRRLATASWDGTARVWDAASGKERLALEGHIGRVWTLSWSPDGARLATGGQDGTAKVWDALADREQLTLQGHASRVGLVAWSPDGARLATASDDGTARVWDAADGRQRLTLAGHTSRVLSVSWSPDASLLATGSAGGTAKVWDAVTGRECLTLTRQENQVTSVAWSPDGRRLAVGSSDGTVRLWQTPGGRELFALKGRMGSVWSVSWSPDGTRLATGSEDGTARVWDAVDGREQLALRGHASRVLSVSWSPDGTRLATASRDGTAKLWDVAAGRELLVLSGHRNTVTSICWSPGGKRLATGNGDGTVRVWDVAGGRELLVLKGRASRVRSVAWSPDGTRLATGCVDGTANIWEAASNAAIQGWAHQVRAAQDLQTHKAPRGPRLPGL